MIASTYDISSFPDNSTVTDIPSSTLFTEDVSHSNHSSACHILNTYSSQNFVKETPNHEKEFNNIDGQHDTQINAFCKRMSIYKSYKEEDSSNEHQIKSHRNDSETHSNFNNIDSINKNQLANCNDIESDSRNNFKVNVGDINSNINTDHDLVSCFDVPVVGCQNSYNYANSPNPCHNDSSRCHSGDNDLSPVKDGSNKNSKSYSYKMGVSNERNHHNKSLENSSNRRDYHMCNLLPPPKENEIEFVIENFMAIRQDPNSSDRYWSQVKTYQTVDFRILVFPKGNKCFRPSNVSVYVAVDPNENFDTKFKNMWIMPRCEYQLLAIHWGNWREKSILKSENFSFTTEDIDRGWVDFIPEEGLKVGEFLGPNGELILRAQICPRSIDTTNKLFWGRRGVDYIGIRNQGATCYLNSLVQSLYHIGSFRKSIFQLTLDSDKAFVEAMGDKLPQHINNSTNSSDVATLSDSDEAEYDDQTNGIMWSEEEIRQAFEKYDETDTSFRNSDSSFISSSSKVKVSLALQSLFLKLSTSNDVVTTDELIRSFGWESHESLTQHDAQELNRILCDRLEEELKGTVAEGMIQKLFMGEFENYVECINVPYGSSRREMFYDLQLDVQNTTDIYDSLRKYLADEILEGDNAYDAEDYGSQIARKGVRFCYLPPVIQFHLKRFTFHKIRMDMVKVNERFEYPLKLDLSEFLPEAGIYELFCVIVHAGDVGGGHYYVINRPAGKDWWMKFDDEKVYPVAAHSALTDCYGGYDSICWDYLKHFDDPNYVPQSPVLKQYSAYILFYVKSDLAKDLLNEPDPNTVNPYLLQRHQSEEEKKQQHLKIQRYVQNYVKIRYVTESSLRGYKGFFDNLYNIPYIYENRMTCVTPMLEVWRSLSSIIYEGCVSDSTLTETYSNHYYGLWYFDGVTIGNPSTGRNTDIRPLPCHLSDSGKREFTVMEHLSWIYKGLRIVWNPTLVILMHPLLQQDKSDIRSVITLYNTILSTKFFIAKLFYPGRKGATLEDQFLVCAGLPLLKMSKEKNQCPLIGSFIELLKSLKRSSNQWFDHDDLNSFIKTAMATYLDNHYDYKSDPLDISNSVYLEQSGMFQHLQGSPCSVIDEIEASKHVKMDEAFPPVLVFSISRQFIEDLHNEKPCSPCLTLKDMPSKNQITKNKELHGELIQSNEIIFDHTITQSAIQAETKENIENNIAENDNNQLVSPSLTKESEPLDLSAEKVPIPSISLSSENLVDLPTLNNDLSAVVFDGSPTYYIPSSPDSIPLPHYEVQNPIDWYYTLTRSCILVNLKLYDPLAVLGRPENCSGEPIEDHYGVNTCEMNLKVTNENDTVGEHESSDEKKKKGSQSIFQTVTSSSALDDKNLLKCPPIKEIQLEVDLRWNYSFAFKYMCNRLGINPYQCIVHASPPFLDDMLSFSLITSPSSIDASKNVYWDLPRTCHTTSDMNDLEKPQELRNCLDELHVFLAGRQNCSVYRDLNSFNNSVFRSTVTYHFSILPRLVTNPVLGLYSQPTDTTLDATQSFSSKGKLNQNIRSCLIRVFNLNVENVGCVLVDLNFSNPLKVNDIINKAKSLITPLMVSRGASKEYNYRLLWIGMPLLDPLAVNQVMYSCNRIDVVTDSFLTSKLHLLTSGFQFSTPLRLEPLLNDSNVVHPSLMYSLSTTKPQPLTIIVLHQNREQQFFGHPFFITVHNTDTLKAIKEKIKNKLELADSTLAKWKFFLYDYAHSSFIKDDEIPEFPPNGPNCLLAVHRYLYANEDRSKSLQLQIR